MLKFGTCVKTRTNPYPGCGGARIISDFPLCCIPAQGLYAQGGLMLFSPGKTLRFVVVVRVL